MTAPNPDLTRLMNLAAQGDSSASDAIVPELYEELRRLARWNMSRMPHGQTLQATALINEAWIRIAGRDDQEWECRKHFYFAAARAMRDILIEDARHKSAEKRGGGRRRVELEDLHLVVEAPTEHMLELDAALRHLENVDNEGFRLVMLRFFTGISMEETAALLETPVRSTERKWRFVRSWLRREMGVDLD